MRARGRARGRARVCDSVCDSVCLCLCLCLCLWSVSVFGIMIKGVSIAAIRVVERILYLSTNRWEIM